MSPRSRVRPGVPEGFRARRPPPKAQGFRSPDVLRLLPRLDGLQPRPPPLPSPGNPPRRRLPHPSPPENRNPWRGRIRPRARPPLIVPPSEKRSQSWGGGGLAGEGEEG